MIILATTPPFLITAVQLHKDNVYLYPIIFPIVAGKVLYKLSQKIYARMSLSPVSAKESAGLLVTASKKALKG